MSGADVAKSFFGEAVFNLLLEYLKKDPEANLLHVFNLVKKAAVLPEHKRYVENFQKGFTGDTTLKKYILRILRETSEKVQYGFLMNFLINASLVGIPKQRQLSRELDVNIPFTILFDPTSDCNLRCRGCWAGAYRKKQSLPPEEVNRIINEARELGIRFFVISGGEPLLWPHLIETCSSHRDAAFLFFTNGTLIDDRVADRLLEAGNMSPAISLEGRGAYTDARRGKGVFEQVLKAMDSLKQRGIFFGISVTATRENCHEVYSDQFLNLMVEKGAFYVWGFHYIPVGSNPDFSLMLTTEQRAALVERVKTIRAKIPIAIADFWNDGAITHGCVAGGRRYFHITAGGDVEPCAFVHFATDKIFGRPLLEILKSPLFKAYQRRQPFSENMLRVCPIIDVPEALREIVDEAGAYPSHEGADTLLSGESATMLDNIAAAWREKAESISSVPA